MINITIANKYNMKTSFLHTDVIQSLPLSVVQEATTISGAKTGENRDFRETTVFNRKEKKTVEILGSKWRERKGWGIKHRWRRMHMSSIFLLIAIFAWKLIQYKIETSLNLNVISQRLLRDSPKSIIVFEAISKKTKDEEAFITLFSFDSNFHFVSFFISPMVSTLLFHLCNSFKKR